MLRIALVRVGRRSSRPTHRSSMAAPDTPTGRRRSAERAQHRLRVPADDRPGARRPGRTPPCSQGSPQPTCGPSEVARSGPARPARPGPAPRSARAQPRQAINAMSVSAPRGPAAGRYAHPPCRPAPGRARPVRRGRGGAGAHRAGQYLFRVAGGAAVGRRFGREGLNVALISAVRSTRMPWPTSCAATRSPRKVSPPTSATVPRWSRRSTRRRRARPGPGAAVQPDPAPRLPQATPPPCCDRISGEGLSPPRTHSASRCTHDLRHTAASRGVWR